MKDTDFAYLAGIMDADGCFAIGKSKRKTDYNYFPVVSIGQIDIDIIQKIANMYNKKIIKVKKEKYIHKDHYRVELRGKDIINFIEKIIPYLMLKQNQAELLLELQTHIIKMDYQGGQGRKLPIKEIEYRESVYKQVCALNQRENKDIVIINPDRRRYKNKLNDLI